MKNCRYCKEEVGNKEQICPYCGYDFKTDTLTPGFISKAKKVDIAKKRKLVGPEVKTFAFWAAVIIIGILVFRYHGKFNDLVLQAKSLFKKDKKSQVDKSVGLISVRSTKVSEDKFKSQDKKIEGLFYDPAGKSYVIINEQLIGEGESFGGIFIKKVNQRSVEIVQDGQSQVVTVKGNN